MYATAMIPEGSSMLTITAVAEGMATITVTASDGDDSVEMIIYVTVDPAPVPPPQNKPPRVKKPIGDRKYELPSTDIDTDVTVVLSDHFEDPEKGPLYYAVTIVSQSPTDTTTTPAPKVIELAEDHPDGTGLKTDLVIDAMNPGSAMVKVVARDAQLAATERTFMITVVAEGGNTAPATVAESAPAGVIANVVTPRLKVGDTKTVIDNRKISEYFSDGDFLSADVDARGDTLTFAVESYVNGTTAAEIVPTATSVLLVKGDDNYVEPLAADKAQVSTSLSRTTWNGATASTFTLSVTAVRGSTADTATEDVVAIIATDEFGQSAVHIFEVRVNHGAEG